MGRGDDEGYGGEGGGENRARVEDRRVKGSVTVS